jgi:hypothetical protein
MNNDGFKEKLEALIPKGLDDIIRKNREHCQIRHATEADLAPILGTVPQAYPKLVITRWHLVTISAGGEYKVVLLGDIADGTGNTWVTSKVVKLDLESGYLLTNSGSLYMMAKGTKGEGEPSFEQLALLCTYINRGGAGAFFGVPEFF